MKQYRIRSCRDFKNAISECACDLSKLMSTSSPSDTIAVTKFLSYEIVNDIDYCGIHSSFRLIAPKDLIFPAKKCRFGVFGLTPGKFKDDVNDDFKVLEPSIYLIKY